jgi:thiol-disulfide isomerase/thioredoxin
MNRAIPRWEWKGMERLMTRRLAFSVVLVLTTACQARAQSVDARLRWKNGDELAGQIVSATADKLVWKSAVSSSEVTLDISVLDSIARPVDDKAALDPSTSTFRSRLARVKALIVIDDPSGLAPANRPSEPTEPTSADGNCELTYDDGTTQKGDLVGIENGSVILQIASEPTPVTFPLSGWKVCQFSISEDEPQPLATHVLEHVGLRVRGTLSALESTLSWRFVGAEAAIPLDLNVPLTIHRTEPAETGPKSATANSDIVLLKSGDRLPCQVESIEPEFVAISTNVGAVSRIAHDDVRAVSFDSELIQQVIGFQGDAWQINDRNDKTVERRDDALIFHDAATVTHPTLLAGGNLEFDVDWNRKGNSQLVMTLLPKARLTAKGRRGRILGMNGGIGALVEPNQPMFYLQFSGNQVTVISIEGHVGRAFNPRRLQETDPVHVCLRKIESKLVLFVNDEEQSALSAPGEEEGAVAVMFSTSQMQRNNRQRGGDLNLTLSNLRAGSGDGLFFHLPILKAAKEYVVTVPRMRRDRPPSHVLIGRNGDLLRGQLRALGPTSVQFESGLNDIVLPRNQLAGVLWLTEPAQSSDAEGDPQAPEQSPMSELPETARAEGAILAMSGTGASLTLSSVLVEGDALVAQHLVVGECRLPLASLETLFVGNAEQQAEQTKQRPDMTEWTLIHAPEPVIPGDNGGFGTYSELVGQPTEDFTLRLLSGGDFRLSEHRGEVIVLDFWATWCGPCIQAMPQLMAAVSAFPGRVRLVAVNQEESPEVVTQFLESRGWDVEVALDGRGEAGHKFRVQGLPQVVIIGHNGIIEHVHLGASPDLEVSLKGVLERLVIESPQSPGE